MTVQESFAGLKNRLSTGFDDTPCRFRHHNPEGDRDFPLCPKAVQERRHGCAHSYGYLLNGIITDMKNEGLLTTTEETSLLHEITMQMQELTQQLDFRYALDILTKEQEEEIFSRQRAIIDDRKQLTQRLLEMVEAAEGKDAAPAQTTRLTSLPLI